VLTLHKILGGRAGAYAAYLTSIEDTGDYYVGPDGDPWAAPGQWLGDLANEWDLSGAVERGALLLVLEGRDPRTGERVVRIWRADRVAAHDLVFSAPSSVTAVWALAGDELRTAIQQAQDEAVREAFAYIEREFALVRRRDPSRRSRGKVAPIISEPAAALLGATFSHHTSRQTVSQAQAGVPPDPQLHTHVLLPGMAKRRDGAFVAINSLELHRRRAEAGAVYRAALADKLATLGFAIERQTGKGGRYFEISGIPVELRDLWSSRHREIAGAAGQWRQEFHDLTGRDPTIFEEREWAAKNRAPKGRYYRSDLFTFWRDAAMSLGVTPEGVEGLRRSGRRITPEHGRAQLAWELLSPEGVTREHATFTLADLRLAAYERSPGLVDPEEVEWTLAEVTGNAFVVEVGPGVWTTREILELERKVLAWRDARTPGRVDGAVAAFRERRAESTHAAARGAEKAPPRAVEEALLRCPVRLSDEQRSVLDRLLSEPFVALTGSAGVGKGVVLRVAADVWGQQHRRIYAVAVGGAQAQRLAADLGPGTEALTLDAFVWRIQHDRLRLGSRDVVALDEAGQVDTRRWAAFTEAVGGQPTVVALGDHAQLSPISAGGLWPLLARGGPTLTEVRRTALEWQREAWACLRRGESATALDLYARHGNLDICATRSEALEAAVAAWDRDGRDGLIITDASNAERHRANTAAQTVRLADLGETAVTAATAEGEVALHVGDPVLFTGKYQGLGMARRVENGTTGQVVGVDPAARSVLVRTHEASPRDLAIAVGDGQQCLDLHYASHVVKSQGTTVRRAYIVVGGWQTHRESLYVAASRSREGTRLFLDRESLGSEVDGDALVEMVRRGAESRAKLAALEGKLPRRPAARSGTPRGRHRSGGQQPGRAAGRPWHIRVHVLGTDAPVIRWEPVGVGLG
jgi:conjugative relaxase-like TrwC/TraI family protein